MVVVINVIAALLLFNAFNDDAAVASEDMYLSLDGSNDLVFNTPVYDFNDVDIRIVPVAYGHAQAVTIATIDPYGKITIEPGYSCEDALRAVADSFRPPRPLGCLNTPCVLQEAHVVDFGALSSRTSR